MDWDWAFTWEILPRLLEGVQITIIATLLSFVVALVLGLAIALVRRSPKKWLSVPIGFAADFIRGTPLLVQLYVLFFVLPSFGIVLSPLVTGVLGLGVHYATYTAEVYRAGIDNVSRGQWEAARACNLGVLQTWQHVVLPQAIPPMVPVLCNYLIAMFKETPLLSAITVLDVMGEARAIANYTFRFTEPITIVGVFFLIMSLATAYLIRLLEKRLRLK